MAQKRITIDANRMDGLPCIRDTRVTVSAVLGQLDAGASIDELLTDYPYLAWEDILAASGYAADSRLSDPGMRAHGLAESPEGELINDEASVRRLLDP
jgi:uncharacterized protein (DUF433 family)